MTRTPQVNSTLLECPAGLLAALGAAMPGPGQVRSRATDRLALGHDASHFALTPSVVVTPVDATEVGRLFAVSAAQGVPLTFRSGGTSLSGQGVTDGILVDTRRHFRDIEILDAGARVRIGPGATVRQVNARLGPFGRKLGPDPASEIACTLGGVVANNSSGMACGTDREHLQHAGFAGAGAAQRHRDRHRRRRRGRTTASPGTRCSTKAWPGSGTGSGQIPPRCGRSSSSSR